jgi:hypothetical protein
VIPYWFICFLIKYHLLAFKASLWEKPINILFFYWFGSLSINSLMVTCVSKCSFPPQKRINLLLTFKSSKIKKQSQFLTSQESSQLFSKPLYQFSPLFFFGSFFCLLTIEFLIESPYSYT